MVGIDDYLLDFDSSFPEEERENVLSNEQIWIDNPQQPQLQLEVDDLFFMDFSPIISDHHFSCMSSTSSTSSTPAQVSVSIPIPELELPLTKTTMFSSPSSSTAASWAVNNFGGEVGHLDLNHLHAGYGQNADGGAPVSTVAASMDVFQTEDNNTGGIFNMDSMNDYVRENFGFMDLMMMDSPNESWDPSLLLNEIENSGGGNEVIIIDKPDPPPPTENQMTKEDENDHITEEDLGEVFLDWLKTNKEHISLEDMQMIKLRTASLESASTRIGKKQLLKQILEWVGQSQLQKRNIPEESDTVAAAAAAEAAAAAQMTCQTVEHFPHPPNPNTVSRFTTPSPWPAAPQQPYRSAYVDPYANMLKHPTWQPGQFLPGSNGSYAAGGGMVGGYSGANHQQQQYSYLPYYYGAGSGGSYSSSATKEARKQRMARQKRNSSQNHQNRNNNGKNPMIPTDNVVPANWVYSPSATIVMPNIGSSIPASLQPRAFDHIEGVRQGVEIQNLRFVLRKILRISDVSNLGRIVLPKRESEIYFPVLESRGDGVTLRMDDIAVPRFWRMRFRFWPNNKSRMYILENTAGFVRANGLEEGDCFMIYVDVKFGTYMIRGVKLVNRQSEPPKPVAKKQMTKSYNYGSLLYNIPSSSSSSWQPYQPYYGQPAYQGQPYQGQSYQGQPYQGQSYQGQSYQGQSYQGQSYQGQSYQGQSYQGQSYQGQPYQGQSYQGQPYQGQPYQGQSYQGQPYQGQPYQGQPYQGQPYQGQPYQDQAYQGQPYQSYRTG